MVGYLADLRAALMVGGLAVEMVASMVEWMVE